MVRRVQYLNFEELKKQLALLDQYLSSQKQANGDSLTWLKLLFQHTLDSEISKVLGFYTLRRKELRATVTQLQEVERPLCLAILNAERGVQKRDVSMSVKIDMVNKLLAKWREAGRTLGHLLMFVSLNMQALRKIVKKQNKLVGTLDPGANADLAATLLISHPHEDTVYRQGSYLSSDAIAALEAMQRHVDLLELQEVIKERIMQLGNAGARLRASRAELCAGDGALAHRRQSGDTATSSAVGPSEIEVQARCVRSRLSATLSRHRTRSTWERPPRSSSHLGRGSVQSPEGGGTPHAASLRRWDSFGSWDSDMSLQDSVLMEIMEAKDLAERNAQLVMPLQTNIATRAGIFEQAPETPTATLLGLSLNLINVFLYMTNYNLVIPTLDAFCEHLRVPASVSGAVIGCADIMAIIVSVGYSLWTNRSFKQPLIFAAATCLVGNLLVTLAYDWGGLPLLLVGRLLTGTGAARALNRRYIADFVSIEGRTTASIGFVAASAAGMALGPFLAVPLTAMLDRYGDTWRIAGWTMNVITVSGWLMVAAWAVFGVVAAILFEEPLKPRAAAAPPAARDSSIDLRIQAPDDDSDDDGGGATKPLLDWFRKNGGGGGGGARRTLEAAGPIAEGADGGGSGDLEAAAAAAAAATGAMPSPFHADGEPDAADGGAPHNVASFSALADAGAPLEPAATDEAEASFMAAAAMLRPSREAPSARTPLRGLSRDAHLLPTAACIVMLFLLKLLQQGAVSAVPLFTIHFYGWDMSAVGLFMAGMSLAMLPLNFSVAAISAMVSDRILMGASLFFCAVGCVFMISLSGSAVPLACYLLSFTLILSFTNILEGVSMSVLSKVIHPALAKGTFNAGLLATQSGSLGRLVGNFAIAGFGSIVAGIVSLANVMFMSFLVAVMLCCLLFYASYSKLQKGKV